MEKVKVTREVADAIHEGLQEFGNSENFLREHAETLKSHITMWYGSYECLNVISALELAELIINGYEVEQSPGEKLRKYYEGLRLAEARLVINGESGSQFRQGWISVIETLDILGIKVEGISEDKTEGDE